MNFQENIWNTLKHRSVLESLGTKASYILNAMSYKVVQIWPGLIVCKQVTVCPGHIWTTLYLNKCLMGLINNVFKITFDPLYKWWNNFCSSEAKITRVNIIQF
jgi:hypothetical protein